MPSPSVLPDVAQAVRALGATTRYRHYANIPGRICRSFDYFQAHYDRAVVTEQLRAYYLFIGVVDQALDEVDLRIGEEVLTRLRNPVQRFDPLTLSLPYGLVTEVLKGHIVPETYPEIIAGLENLYQSVVQERHSVRVKDYLPDRRKVGVLTSAVSFQLIKPHLHDLHDLLYSFLIEVGALGCLCDSVIDWKEDVRNGLLGFSPTWYDRLKLAATFVFQGGKILWRNPRLLPLFLAAMGDNVKDADRPF